MYVGAFGFVVQFKSIDKAQLARGDVLLVILVVLRRSPAET